MHTTPIAVVAVVAAVLGSASPASSQTQPRASTPSAPVGTAAPKAGSSLKVGMPAPQFKVERFLKGRPFTKFEKGKVYVVEFWATWCGPCVMSMPHLSELQRQYKSKGVTICGVNVWQEKQYTSDTLEKVSAFVEKKGAVMDYAIAYDGATKHMDREWLRAAGRDSIPCAFVVDKEGLVTWIGHPRMLDMVLDEVTRGTWEPATGRDRLMAAASAFGEAGKKYKQSVAAGEAAWAVAMRAYPVLGKSMSAEKFAMLMEAKRIAEALKLGVQLVDEGMKAKDAGRIQAVLGAMNNADVLKESGAKELFLKAALANLDLADGTEAGPYVLLGRAYLFNGELEKGREAAAKAAALSPADVRQGVEGWLKQMETEAGVAPAAPAEVEKDAKKKKK